MQYKYARWVILLIVCGVVFWLNADERHFWGKHGEARRAEVSREMLTSGEWVIPHLNGEPFITKPPLFYWSAALAFKLSGKVDEFSARLPSLICGTLGVLVVCFWAGRIFSPQAGLLAGVILATSFLYAGMAQNAEVDMMLTLFTTAALCCFALGAQEFSRSERQTKFSTWAFLLTAVWIGLGTMAKNPIGLAVPLLAIGGYILVTRKFALILAAKPWWGLLIFLAIVSPWFVLVYQRIPDFFNVLHQETLGRYTNPEGAPHLEPFYYYFPSLGAFAPWVTFLPAVIISLFSQGFRKLSKPYLFLIVAAVTTFMLFSSVGSKREYYLLPLYPVLAILVAKVWNDYLRIPRESTKRLAWKSMDIPILGFAGVFCVAGPGLPIAAKLYLPGDVLISLGFGVLLLLAGILLFVLFFKRKTQELFWVYSIATMCLYLCVLTTIVPEIDRYRSRRAFFQETASIIADNPVAHYKYFGYESPFYLQRVVELCHSPEQLEEFITTHNPGFVILSGEDYVNLSKEAPALAAKLEVIKEEVWTSAMNPKRQRRMLVLTPKPERISS